MSKNLFDGSDDDAEDLQLTTNENYAKSYNVLRKKELLKKYKDRGLDVSESELDSDSESSDEDEAVDVKFDQEFFKTLASLKSKDPKIYDKETRFFNGVGDDSDEDDGIADGERESKKKKAPKTKPVTLKDYERKVILEHNGKFESSEDEDQPVQERADSPTAVEEERRLRAEFTKVMNKDDESEDEEFGGIFKKREKTKAQTDAEEADYAKWLAGKQEEIEQSAKEELAPLRQYWSSSKLTQGESFLRDYILSKGYANTDVSEIPTYDEIVGDNAPLSEDEQELEKQAEFEQKYNFRFEEPDADFIKRYPRTIEQSVRRTDDKRKDKRKELKQRKEQEKKQKMKELEIIKDMKRKEIEEKIRKLKAVTGNDELGFKDDELEEDFDPAAHDRRMQEIFNEEYYNVDEGEEKPECPSDIEELAIEDWDNYDPHQNYEAGGDDDLHCEDDEFNMDCDYDPTAAKQQLQQELIENTRSRKGRKGRRNRFMEMIQAEKPAFNPDDEKTYGEYIDEYYQLDYEDIVGDQPCRFKYVETTPNDFGLTIEEILLAKNKELNQWASLKKAVQTRPEHVEKKEQRMYKMKAKNEELKRKIFKSLYGEGSDDEEQPEKNTVDTSTAGIDQSSSAAAAPIQPSTELMSKSKKKRLRRKAAAAASATVAEAITQQAEASNENKEDIGEPAAKKKRQAPNEEQQTNGDADPTTAAPAPTATKTPKNANKSDVKLNPFKKTQQAATIQHGKPTVNAKLNNKNKGQGSRVGGKNTQLQPNQDGPTATDKSKNASKSDKSNPFKKREQAVTTQHGKPTTNATPFNKNKEQESIDSKAVKAEQQTNGEVPTVTKQSNNPEPKHNPFKKPQRVGTTTNAKPFNKNKGLHSGAAGKPFMKSRNHNTDASKKKKNVGPRKTHNFKAKNKTSTPNGITDERLKAYGINPRKFHKTQKYGKKAQQE
ncbi:protein KRI1 homolog [Scaptodrosophila lebanonensis]|uniref:Protein KRI1 homolog n=1 Tax=Drosophila lebanonensis TaxID=7225 RepID=A0A6J2UBE4_DROLE|nr:protein KRI1 homolog [Scaptodrosophila lebanonensis]